MGHQTVRKPRKFINEVGVCEQFDAGRVQAEGDKLKTQKFGKLFELLITFEIVSQSQKSLVH